MEYVPTGTPMMRYSPSMFVAAPRVCPRCGRWPRSGSLRSGRRRRGRPGCRFLAPARRRAEPNSRRSTVVLSERNIATSDGGVRARASPGVCAARVEVRQETPVMAVNNRGRTGHPGREPARPGRASGPCRAPTVCALPRGPTHVGGSWQVEDGINLNGGGSVRGSVGDERIYPALEKSVKAREAPVRRGCAAPAVEGRHRPGREPCKALRPFLDRPERETR